MAAVEIPWSRIVRWSPGGTPFGLTPSGVLTLNRVLPGVLTTDTAVPAGSASIRVAELPGGGELGRYGYALRTFGGALLVPTNLDGATLEAGYAYPRHNPAVWTPEWNTPGGDIVLEMRLWSSALGLHAAKLSGLIVGPSTVGDLQYWDSLDLATTVAPGYVFPTWPVSGVDGPWVSAFASGTVLAVRKTWTGTKTITVPLRQTGSTMTATLTAPGGATLLSAGGATVSGSTLTIPPGVQCVPKWEATGGATLTLTKGAPAIVASYAPVFVETPVVPPTPPTITKLIPTSGPDTGGTLVDIVGTDLTGATAVDFGGAPGTGLTVDPSGNLATVTTPAHTAGPAPVTITTPAGVSNAETFTFEAPIPPGPVVVAVFPGAARPGATIQIVGTNLTGATVTMCGEPVSILSNDGNIITVVVPPGCPDGPATITVTTPDGETTVEFTVLPVPEPGECPSLTDWCAPDTPCPDCTPCVVAPARPLIAMWADLAARIRCGWPDDRCPPGAVTVEATQQPPGSDCDAEVQVIPGGPAGADHAGVTTWGGRVVVLRPWAQINEAGQLTDAAQAQRLEAIARSLEDLQIMQQLIVAAACGACEPGGATIDRVERVTSTTTLGWAFTVRIS